MVLHLIPPSLLLFELCPVLCVSSALKLRRDGAVFPPCVFSLAARPLISSCCCCWLCCNPLGQVQLLLASVCVTLPPCPHLFLLNLSLCSLSFQVYRFMKHTFFGSRPTGSLNICKIKIFKYEAWTLLGPSFY